MSNICLSIATQDSAKWHNLVSREPLVELRADLMGISPEVVAELLPLTRRAIVTCHTADLALAEGIYSVAIERGAWAVDIAHTMERKLRDSLVSMAQEAGVKVILSHHYPTTPSFEELRGLAERLFADGCDIAKIITTATTTAEALVPLGLYEHFEADKVVAFAMGEAGSFSRRLSLLLGAPHTYAAPSAEERTALGQPTIEELRESLRCGESLEGYTLPNSITPPSSKSEVQRAIVIAALIDGNSVLHGYTPCDDSQAAIDLARQLGAKVTIEGNEVVIEGVGTKGLRERLSQPTILSVGESALLARLIMPIVALWAQSEVTVTGRGTLLGRSMEGDIKTLESVGVRVEHTDHHLPIKISGGAKVGNKMEIDGSHSSQTASGWMVALASEGVEREITIRNVVSISYILMTDDLLEKFGGNIVIDFEEEMRVHIIPYELHSASVRLSADWSSAAYFATAYAIAQSGFQTRESYTLYADLNTYQADKVIMEILHLMGARMESKYGEFKFLPGSRLRAVEFDATHTPDLIPTLAVLALFAEGCSRIGGLHRLRNKESNRTEAVVENLVALGAKVAIEGDELVIDGGRELHSAPLRSHSDHRIAMALTLASLFMERKPTLDNKGCVAKSYPDFFEQLRDKTL